MTTASFGGWTVEVDRDATLRAQRLTGPSGPASCGCLYCRNLLAARLDVYPANLARFLAEVGIPDNRETWVTELGAASTGCRLYISLFHFIGRVLTFPKEAKDSLKLRDAIYPLSEAFPKQGVLELSVTFEAPWVLHESVPA